MSRSNYCGYPREKLVKFEDKRTGWFGESCWAQEGRKYIKKLQHRHNRRNGKKQIKVQITEFIKELQQELAELGC